ncbi:MAG: peptide deformylase [Verrucomicrobiales bacterium]|nr:peptide deformylase [Verrucomicrobiales bacterium]
MLLEIVKYGHPALRERGKKIKEFNGDLHQLARDMIETMADAHGVGLAAQQIARALQLFVIDVRGAEDRPSTMEVGGRSVNPEDHMPMILINTRVRPTGDPETGPEGCLSFPELYGDITRPASVEVSAVNERGEPVQFHCGGLLARAIQHELDHTQGVLFIDRMPREVKAEMQPDLDALHAHTKATLSRRG